MIGKGLISDEITFTGQLIEQGKEFLFTKGIDIAQGLIILCIGYFICRHIRKVVEKLLNKSDIDHSANSFIVEIIYFFCLAIVIIMALSTMGVSAATLAAAFGGIGLAIALGLKDNIGNVASGIFILIFRPFKIGDFIKIGDNEGEVKNIRIMYTELATLGNQLIAMPNSTLTNSVIKNYSQYDVRNIEFTFDVGYGTDLNACLRLIKQIFHEDKRVLNKDKLPMYVDALGENSIKIYVRPAVERKTYYETRTDLYIKVKEAFDAAGIDIPYPQLVVHQDKKE